MGNLKRWILAASFFFLTTPLWAPMSSRLNIQETDGSPSIFPWQLKVSPGTLTDNGDGTATLTTGGGGGGGGYAVQPATVTFQLDKGVTTSTLTVTSTSTLNYVTASSTVNATNFSGGGLSTCGSTSQAQSYSSVTGLFGCTTITAAGIGALTGNQSITVSGDESGTGTTAITLTAAATQPNIKTLSASSTTFTGNMEVDGWTTHKGSVSVQGAGGLGVTYNVNAGSMTGAGLSTCGDSSHAVGWSSTNNLFTCQSITGTGTSAASPLYGVQISSPNGTFAASGNFTYTGSSVVINSSGLNNSTLFAVNGKDTTNNPSAMVITSTGTGIGIQVIPQGIVSGGYANDKGLVTIGDTNSGRTFSTLLVLVDSTTDAQLGGGIFELLSKNPNHNDPLFWIKSNSANSGPDMRVDSQAFNFEFVNLSTDTAHGKGKYEIAMANKGVDFQVNSRAYDNTTFENLAYWHALQFNDAIPGLYLEAQTLANDSTILTSSDTSAVSFFSQNAHTVGLTGPLNPTASYTFGLPSTVGTQGQVLFHNGNRGNNFNVRQMDWTSGGSANSLLQFNGTAAPTWTASPTVSTITLTSIATPSSPADGALWNDSTQKTLVGRYDGINQYNSGEIYALTVSSTVSNTSSETNIINAGIGTNTLPANFFVSGKTVYVVLYATYTTTLTPTIDIKAKYGATTILDSGAVTQATVTGTNVLKIEIVITCRSTGSSGTVMSVGRMDQNTGTTGVAGIDLNSTLTTINTTTSNALQISFTWGSASSSNTVTFTNGFIKVAM